MADALLLRTILRRVPEANRTELQENLSILPVVALRCRGQAVNILRRNGTQHGSIRIRARMVALVHEHHAVALHEFFQSFAFSQRRDHRNIENSGHDILTAL